MSTKYCDVLKMTYRDVSQFVSQTFKGFKASPQATEIGADDVLPEPLVEALTSGNDKIYAVLDAGRVNFLADRLEMTNLNGRMIYRSNQMRHSLDDRDDPMAEVSPWLIEVDPHHALVHDFFSADPDNNWHMMPARAGILLRTALPQNELLSRLLRLSQLPDEAGKDLFFRFQEPGMLAALCGTVPTETVAGILDGISTIIWTEDTVIDGEWQANILSPVAGLQANGWHGPRIDATVRKAFADVINRRRAHLILRESDIAPADRSALVDDLTHLLGASQSSSGAMLHHLRLVAIAPPADRPYWREMVDKGDISLAFINRKMHNHYIPSETFEK